MRAVKEEFNMGFKPATDTVFKQNPNGFVVSGFDPAQNNTPAQYHSPSQPSPITQEADAPKANIAERGAANQIANVGGAAVVDLFAPGLGTMFSMANNAFNAVDYTTAGIELYQENKISANHVAVNAAQRTQHASFKPSTDTNDFPTRSIGKNHSFTVNYKPTELPSATDGMLTRMNVTDLSAPMGKLAAPFKAPTLGR